MTTTVNETVNEPVNETQQTTEQTQQQNILFGTISYADDAAYEEFLGNMNINHALFVLIASANFSQSKGVFNLLESETISTAIRTIRKNGEAQEEAQK
jgi:hypothetical protein